MAASTAVPFPAFPPNLPTHPSRRPSTEVRFSRWNNANAEPFLRRQRRQQEIEDDLRRHRRYQSATRIMEDPSSTSSGATPTDYRSRGTPSAPSRPSIPGKASKYSKPENPGHRASAGASHPAFRRSRASGGAARIPLEAAEGRPEVTVGESGIAYRFAGAPFEFQYSYTETPKAAPLALREPPIVPFGPGTTPRPWTGRAPLPPSKKKLPEFDSFRPPPPGKKGVKPVQAPGPFLAGSGPKYNAASREEILGEPLTAAEVAELIQKTLKTKRQLNIGEVFPDLQYADMVFDHLYHVGRDGLTHNMLDNIHALWKRRRVCKIKCKGVCTVDMDNVRHQLEEKTGGKIIYGRGGVMYLFRGRNYNYKTRPRFPLMLWKPIPPVYPRLVQRVPEGLTLEDATELRKRGRQLPPICKLGKNGVYYKLVKNVKEAFEECELVRINCQGLNKSDTRKIGSKLKDLVPCVLLSFELEHILVWRGKDWKCSLPAPEDNSKETVRAGSDSADGTLSSSELVPDVDEESSVEDATESSDEYPHLDMLTETKALAIDDQNIGIDDLASPREVSNQGPTSFCGEGQATAQLKTHGETRSEQASTQVPGRGLQLQVVHNYGMSPMEDASKDTSTYKTEIDNQLPRTPECQANLNLPVKDNGVLSADSSDPHTECGDAGEPPSASESASVTEHEIGSARRGSDHRDDVASRECMEKIMSLLKQATENGSAIVLGEDSSDANAVRERVIELAKVAPPGPVFRRRPSGQAPVRKIAVKKSDEREKDPGAEKISATSENRNAGKKSGQRRGADVGAGFLDGIVLPQGSLGVDELARLLR